MLTTIDVQSSINENSCYQVYLQINGTEIDNIKPGKTFKKKLISPLQPYEGDILIEGRFN
jgi:hypothetical protein